MQTPQKFRHALAIPLFFISCDPVWPSVPPRWLPSEVDAGVPRPDLSDPGPRFRILGAGVEPFMLGSVGGLLRLALGSRADVVAEPPLTVQVEGAAVQQVEPWQPGRYGLRAVAAGPAVLVAQGPHGPRAVLQVSVQEATGTVAMVPPGTLAGGELPATPVDAWLGWSEGLVGWAPLAPQPQAAGAGVLGECSFAGPAGRGPCWVLRCTQPPCAWTTLHDGKSMELKIFEK